MESYVVGEVRYLLFELEVLQEGDYAFPVASGEYKPYYNLTVKNNAVVEGGEVEVIDHDTLRVKFEPTEVGQHILDIWYYVYVGTAKKATDEGVELYSNIVEKRTARIILPVVR